MKPSARNQIKGTVTSIGRGAMNGVVRIEVVPGIVMTSSITDASIKELKLEGNVGAYVAIKVSNVVIGIES